MKLWQQVILGLVLGAITGYILHEFQFDADPIKDAAQRKEWADNIKILGIIFINLIKMVMVPLIFFALLAGITAIGSSKDFKRVGFKAVTAYMTTVVFAVCIGLTVGNIFHPGASDSAKDLVRSATHANAESAAAKTPPALKDTLLSIIPDNAIGAMAKGDILQVIIFAVFVAAVINALGTRVKGIIEIVQEASLVMFKVIEIIVKLAPFGVFGYITNTVALQGVEALESLFWLVVAVLFACLIQYVVFGLLITFFGRLSPFPFYKKMIGIQTIAFSTTSSKATLPIAMEQLGEKMGVSRNSRNFVLPLGAAINMDGTAIYLGICALFFAQALGVHLGPHEYLMIIVTSTLGSIGAAGIPSGSLIFMGMVLTSVGLPIEGIALIAGVDRILDMFRTTINITGDAAITLIIDKSEGKLNDKTYYDPAL